MRCRAVCGAKGIRSEWLDGARRHKKALRVADPEGATEREGFEPPSPFGRSLSRRVQYHSASAPKRRHKLGKQTAAAFGGTYKSGRPDSNRGPLRPERSALPD